jgi:hypothetical protein
MERKQIFGLIGTILLFFGVFTPIVSVPILGNINYFNNGKGDGAIILVLSIVSFILVLRQAYKGLLFTGLGSLAVLTFTFINFQAKMNDATNKLNADLADNPFRGLADTAINSFQLQWGWALLVIGSVLVITSSVIKNDIKESTTIDDKNVNKTELPDKHNSQLIQDYPQPVKYKFPPIENISGIKTLLIYLVIITIFISILVISN